MPILFILIESINLQSFDLSSTFSKYITSTFLLIIYTCAISIILAVIPAWIITYNEIKYKSTFDLLLILPLSIPGYIMAFTYADMLGFNGYIDVFLQTYLNTRLNLDVLSIEWLSLFLALSLYPYIYMTTRISFKLIGSTYINLSKSLGLNKTKTFFKIILPLSISAILSGTLLVTMEILNEYGAVNYFGIQTFSVGIFKYWFSMDDKSTAIIFSVFLLIIVLFLITTLKYLKRHDKRIKYHIKTSPFVYPKQHSRKIVNYTLICIPILFGLFIPIIFILNNIKSNFHKYDLIELSHVFKNTFIIALFTAILITIISFFIISVKRHNNKNKIKLITNFLSAGYAIPGAVIGLAFMLIIQYLSPNLNFLMGTITLLIYAYIFRFIAVAIFPLESNFKQQPLKFDELGKSLKLSMVQIIKKINFPLSKFAILSSFLLVFIDVFKELPLTLILRPFNYETLATQAYQYANEELLSYSSIYSMCIIIVCSFVIIISKLIFKDRI
ncbi:MAG: hypothetical protein CMP65_05275 [Flavobacteriales bacterium]|nr:hypothetical protein [Flavobacteriales bacterium]